MHYVQDSSHRLQAVLHYRHSDGWSGEHFNTVHVTLCEFYSLLNENPVWKMNKRH